MDIQKSPSQSNYAQHPREKKAGKEKVMGTWDITTKKRMSFRFMKGEENGRTKRQYARCVWSTYEVNMQTNISFEGEMGKIRKEERQGLKTRFTCHPKNKVKRPPNTNILTKTLELVFYEKYCSNGEYKFFHSSILLPIPRITLRQSNKLQIDNNTKAAKAKTGVYICLPHFFLSHSLFYKVDSFPTTSLEPLQPNPTTGSILPEPMVPSLSSNLMSSQLHSTQLITPSFLNNFFVVSAT